MNATELTRVLRLLQAVFAAAVLDQLGRDHGQMQRSRTITPSALGFGLIATMATLDVDTLADLHRGFNATNDVATTYKPFWNQLAKPQFPRFAHALFAHLLAHLTQPVLEALPGSILSRFSDILIQDGSSFALADGLADVFPGRFTAVSPAAVELHVTYSLFTDSPVRVHIAPDSQGERDFLPAPTDLMNKLLFADRGYQDIGYCHDIDQAGGAFINRFKTNLNPTILSCRIHGSRHKKFEDKKLRTVMSAFAGKTVDLMVKWPSRKSKPTLRLVLIWNPVHDRHILLATNLDRAEAPPWVLMTLYRLRWQIELLFKTWKSWSNVHGFATTNPFIAEGLIWIGLCAAFVKRFLAHATEAVCDNVEISTLIVAKAARHHIPRLFDAIRTGRHLNAALRRIVQFLADNAKRTNAKRDQRYGRRQGGVRPVCEGFP